MKNIYTHLSLWERTAIFRWYHYEKQSMREIARRLDRNHSTISREISRNTCREPSLMKYRIYIPTYYPHPAHRMARYRLRTRASRPKLKGNHTQQYVINKLQKGWSPEIIAGRLKHHPNLEPVSHEAIYQFIYKESPGLVKCLARQHKHRRKKFPTRKFHTNIANKTMICDRPEHINNRSEYGHWESDTIESKGRNGGLNVLVERASRLTHITKLNSKKASATEKAIIRRLSRHPVNMTKSITYDNGSENAGHQKINEQLNTNSYFCQPYHSWEKGAVEQVNSLIRRFIPKKTDISEISGREIYKIEKLLNNRPRKCLNYRTPYEVFREQCGALLL
jgi:IS30 family transposase